MTYVDDFRRCGEPFSAPPCGAVFRFGDVRVEDITCQREPDHRGWHRHRDEQDRETAWLP